MYKVLSRYKSPRTFYRLSDTLIKMVGEDVQTYEISYRDNSDCPMSKFILDEDKLLIGHIDPDGGPLLAIGSKISFPAEHYSVTSFNKIELDDTTKILTVLMNVKKTL
jgi:hypothetical protein